MDEKQRFVVKLAIDNHSGVLVTGQAGCGKTWTLSNVVKELRERGKIVHVTATTGMWWNL